jgi:hypothetical protein
MREKVDGFGYLFRFITPILITVLSTLILTNITSLKTDFKERLDKMDVYFVNHLAHHQAFEIGLENRLTKLEAMLAK